MYVGGVILLPLALVQGFAPAGWPLPVACAGALGGVLLVGAAPRVFFPSFGIPAVVQGRDVIASAGDFLAAAGFLAAWIWPEAAKPWGGMDRAGEAMLFEFLAVHSCGFLLVLHSSRGWRARVGFWALSALYTILVTVISIHADSVWPLLAFGFLTLNRLGNQWLSAKDQSGNIGIVCRWVVSVLLFFLFAGLAGVLPLPVLGGPTLKDRHVHALGFGTMYFLALGFYELLAARLFSSDLMKPDPASPPP